jgi:hypothetical protein
VSKAWPLNDVNVHLHDKAMLNWLLDEEQTSLARDVVAARKKDKF